MNRRSFLEKAGAAAMAGPLLPKVVRAATEPDTPVRKYEIAAYYFGNYHVDPRNERAHGPGWTEWNLVRNATARFPGHRQPKVPLWGYGDEADPMVFERKIQAASDHGLTAFIFDWYWYEDGPFLERALEKGFLQASNRARMKFSIMWANHNWTDIHPAKLAAPPHLQYAGPVTAGTFRRITDRLIERYFTQPNYWLIEGCPYFSVYEPVRLIEGLGGMHAAAEQIAGFRERVKLAGFPDLHLNIILWGQQLLPGQTRIPETREFLRDLGADSIGSYVWVHHAEFKSFPIAQYDDIAGQYERYRATAAGLAGKPYIPNVTVGWDSSPRACQTDTYIQADYPFTPVIQGNSPQRFGAYLRSAKEFLDASGAKNRILTVNSWNEWTEGSYLEPDVEHRLAYLEQIAKVFESR